MAIRDFQFVVGAETSTLPTSGTPSSPSDTITLGYADDHYVQGGDPVADLTALAAVGSSDRANGDALLVLSSNTFYRFDSGSAASADGLRVVAPASGSGRWFRVRPGETASNGDYAVAGDIAIGGDATISGNVEVTGNATINGTLTAINSTTLEVVDANILINNGGNTASADLADAGFTVEISDGTNAKVGYNSTLPSKFMCGNVGSESEIITASTTQTVTGPKTFDTAVTLKEITTPSTPSTGYQSIYPKADGKLYKIDDNGIEQAIGTGAGGGSINFIANPDAETDTAGWSVYSDAAGVVPVDGTGGSPNVTWTRSTSSPLRGTASFLFTKDAANRQGQGVSYAFTIDSADVSKTLQISFDFDGSLTGYAAGDLTAYIYDVGASALITPAAVSLAGAKYQFQTTFVASTSTSYRLILHVASTSATAYTAKFDNVVVGPQLLTLGVAQTEWINYTPTTTWVSGTATGKYRRVGDTIEAQVQFACTSTQTGNCTFALPPNLTFDLTKLASGITNSLALPGSSGTFYDATGSSYPLEARYLSSNSVVASTLDDATNGSIYVLVDGGAPVAKANGDIATLNFSAPIAEWAGSGVYLSTAQPEYAYNSSTSTTTDSTSFGYGPFGAQFVNLASTGITKRVRFLTPIQVTDQIRLQYFKTNVWVDAGNFADIMPFSRQSGTEYGAYFQQVSGSTTDVDVFFTGWRLASGATYASNGVDWSAVAGTANFRWRVVKIPGQVQVASPVNFGTPTAFTPTYTGLPTGTVNTHYYMTRPNTIVVWGSVSISATNANGMQIPMPAGYSIKNTLYPASSRVPVGNLTWTTSAGGDVFYIAVDPSVSSYLVVRRASLATDVTYGNGPGGTTTFNVYFEVAIN